MSKQKIKLQPEDIRFNFPGTFFVEYKLNGGIATMNGTIMQIKEDLNYYLGEGKYSLQHEKGKMDE